MDFARSRAVIPTKRKELKINRFQLLFSYPEICGEKRKKTCGMREQTNNCKRLMNVTDEELQQFGWNE